MLHNIWNFEVTKLGFLKCREFLRFCCLWEKWISGIENHTPIQYTRRICTYVRSRRSEVLIYADTGIHIKRFKIHKYVLAHIVNGILSIFSHSTSSCLVVIVYKQYLELYVGAIHNWSSNQPKASIVLMENSPLLSLEDLLKPSVEDLAL